MCARSDEQWIGHAHCNFHSDHPLTINPADLTFTRKAGTPSTVVIADGTPRVDERPLAIGSADKRRLRDIERGVRECIPEVRAIAHAAMSIAFEAVGEVAAAFARDTESARASAQRLSRAAHELDARIDSSNGFLGWRTEEVDRVVGGAVQSLVGELAATVDARALSVAVATTRRGPTSRHVPMASARRSSASPPGMRGISISARWGCDPTCVRSPTSKRAWHSACLTESRSAGFTSTELTRNYFASVSGAFFARHAASRSGLPHASYRSM